MKDNEDDDDDGIDDSKMRVHHPTFFTLLLPKTSSFMDNFRIPRYSNPCLFKTL